MSGKSRVMAGLHRGLRLRCPHCGEGHLFGSFMKVEDCGNCGADNTVYPCDDAPPYLTLFLVGHLFVPLVLMMDRAWSPPMWVTFAVWLPMITFLTLATMPFMKGAVVGICWANGITCETARQ